MPSELITKGFWVRVPRYEGFHVVRTVSRWVFVSGAKGTGALMPSEPITKGFCVAVPSYEGFHAMGLSTGGFWVLVQGIRVLTCCHDCKQVGSWF